MLYLTQAILLSTLSGKKNRSGMSTVAFTKKYDAHWRWAVLLHLISLLKDFGSVKFDLVENSIHIRITEDDVLIPEYIIKEKLALIQNDLSKLCCDEIKLLYLPN